MAVHQVLRVLTPLTPKRATHHEDCCPDPRAIVHTETLDLGNRGAGHGWLFDIMLHVFSDLSQTAG